MKTEQEKLEHRRRLSREGAARFREKMKMEDPERLKEIRRQDRARSLVKNGKPKYKPKPKPVKPKVPLFKKPIIKGQREVIPKSSPFYLNNAMLREELIKCKQNGALSNDFGKMYLTLVDRLAKKSNFNGYSFLDEMKSEAIFHFTKYWKNIQEDKNVFAYLTQIAKNAFITVIGLEYKHRQIRYDLAEQGGVEIGWDNEVYTTEPSLSSEQSEVVQVQPEQQDQPQEEQE